MTTGWRVVGASRPGSAHLAAGLPCDDHCWSGVATAPDGRPVLLLLAADGAGSARHGGEGAATAIGAAALYATRRLPAAGAPPSARLAHGCLRAARTAIAARASVLDAPTRDFACTLLGLVSHDGGTLAFQVGDGAVVVDAGDGLQLAVPPMSGEYANMTHFATDDDAPRRLQHRAWPVPARRAAVLTDGLQRLMLRMAEQVPHAPLFDRLFDVVAGAPPGQHAALLDALHRFLDSDAVAERTDDDKTLVLATALPR